VDEAGHERLERRLVRSRPDADSAPNVLPWYEPTVETIPARPVAIRANFKAASTASVPELHRNAY
jgi:hypothetical protein